MNARKKPETLPAVVPAAPRLPAKRIIDARRIVDDLLGRLAPRSQRAYKRDLQYFAEHLGLEDEAAMGNYLARNVDHGEAYTIIMEWRNSMVAKGLASATINRRLAAVRTFIKAANAADFLPWTITVPGLKQEAKRDMRGPGEDGFKAMLAACISPRDRAILRLLYGSGLRRSEVVSIDLGDIDFAAGTVLVKGKGKREKASTPIPPHTREALAAWIKVRGTAPGPLFFALSGGRLSDNTLYQVVVDLGKKIGITVRPHGLRHSSVTMVADKKGVRVAQSFARHANIQTTMGYIDNRQNEAKEGTEVVDVDEPDRKPKEK